MHDMDEADRGRVVRVLVRTAERLDSLADVADLMGDAPGAARLREEASERRLRAMAILDGC